MIPTDPTRYLAHARLLTEWTGAVSDAQTKTLNLWPAVMFEGLRKHEINIHLDQHKVVFKLWFRKGKNVKNFTILAKLESAVWQLLGDSWLTIVKADRRIIFTGSRRKEFLGGPAVPAVSPRPGGEKPQPQGA